MSDRLQAALAAVVHALLPSLPYAATWEATVIGATAGPPVTISCTPSDVSALAIFGPLVNITLWPGPSGAYAVPQPGSLVRFAFVNGDPTKPAIVGLDPNATPLTVTAPAQVSMALAGGATALVPAPWATALAGDLATFAGACAAAVSPPPSTLIQVAASVIAIGAAGAALGSALGSLPPDATTKVTAT